MIATDMFIMVLKIRIMIRYQIKEGTRLPTPPEAPLPAERQSRFIGMQWVSPPLVRKGNYNGAQDELATGMAD